MRHLLRSRAVDDCGPQYITIGNAGTMDGMSNTVVDTDLQPYCQNASLYTTPWYQPTASGQVRCLLDRDRALAGWAVLRCAGSRAPSCPRQPAHPPARRCPAAPAPACAPPQPLLTYQGGAFCPTEQPAYSAWREMTYGGWVGGRGCLPA